MQTIDKQFNVGVFPHGYKPISDTHGIAGGSDEDSRIKLLLLVAAVM